MNWFQHDTDSTQDAKLKKLLIRHGAIGYAIYFHCLELIASDISESNLTFELEHDAEIIASNLFIKGTAERSGIEIVEQIMKDIISLGLFQESEGRIFCLKMLKRINMSMTSNPTFRAAINEKKEQYHDTVMIRHDDVMSRHETLPTLPTLHKQQYKDNTDSAKPRKVPEVNPKAVIIAQSLLSLHQLNVDSNFKKPESTVHSWASDIDKLNRIDGRDYEEISKVLNWCKTRGNFWAANIISGKKFREKYAVLYGQMVSKPKEKNEPFRWSPPK